MQNVKVWLFGAFIAGALAATALTGPSPTAATAQERERLKSHWRHHDGHWDYWHEGDKRWYHTDGKHWFYRDGKRWQVYTFDKGFGRADFERGKYMVPKEGVKIVPRHEVYRPR